ncbi:MAG: serine/threonine protein kinase [Planctomycetes bacterium]|nr:serine/threonine protein kinase [Planctomycetota bacterium]
MTRRIGPYEVVRELGRGGMGVVYEVTDPALPRRLALKLILDRADADALARFGREVELLARVRHPNVVAVHSVGRAPEGPYVLMDLVEGEPLSRHVGRLDAARAVEVVRALCDAVGALHAQGVLHRDLKPQNVIVRPDGRPVLLDFGLARDPVGGANLTRTGQILGTPSYMAPEQAEGTTTEPLDARTDVYGLGAVLFELLAGAPPFAEVDGGVWAVVFAVVEREPRWPEVPEVDQALGAVLRRAMAKRPDERYATAGALKAALGAAPRAAASARGRSRRAPLLAAALGLVVGLVGVVAWRATPPPPTGEEPATAEPPREEPAAQRSPEVPPPPRAPRPLAVHDATAGALDLTAGDLPAVAWAGERLAVATRGAIQVLHEPGGPARREAVGLPAPPAACFVALPGHPAVLWAAGRVVVTIDVDALALAGELRLGGDAREVSALATDGRLLAIGTVGGELYFAAVRPGVTAPGPAGAPGPVRALGLTRDGERLVCLTSRWGLEGSAVTAHTLGGAASQPAFTDQRGLTFHALALLDERHLVAAGEHGGLMRLVFRRSTPPTWIADDGRLVDAGADAPGPRVHGGAALDLAASARRLYSLGRIAPEPDAPLEVRVWALPDLRPVGERRVGARGEGALALDATGGHLAIAGRGRVEVWAAADLEEAR